MALAWKTLHDLEGRPWPGTSLPGLWALLTLNLSFNGIKVTACPKWKEASKVSEPLVNLHRIQTVLHWFRCLENAGLCVQLKSIYSEKTPMHPLQKSLLNIPAYPFEHPYLIQVCPLLAYLPQGATSQPRARAESFHHFYLSHLAPHLEHQSI